MKQIAKLKDDARRYELQEEWDKAIDAYQQVLRLSDDGDFSELDLPLYNRVGDLFVRLGKPLDAVKYYEQAADRYAEAGLYNNAIALCNKALRYEASRLPLLKKLGAFSASQGFFTDARRWYLEFAEKSLKRGAIDDAFAALSELARISEDPEIRELLARQLREYGREAEAIQEFKRLHAMLVAAGHQSEADAIAAELKQLDPNVELIAEGPVEVAQQAHDWYYLEELPGFVDVETPTPAIVAPAVSEPEAEPEPTPEPEPVVDEAIEPPVDFAAQAPDEPSRAVEEEALAFDDTEATDFIDLPELSFDDLGENGNVASEPISDIVHDEPLDFGPLDVEVEEQHQLIDISGLQIDPDSYEKLEGSTAFAEFEDFGIDVDEDGFELPMLDLGEMAEPAPELDALDALEPSDTNEPALPPYAATESGSITSFDESEFGDYAPEPEARVFDFSDDEEVEEPAHEEPQEREAVTQFEAAAEVESQTEFDEPAEIEAGEGEFEAEAALESWLAPISDFEAVREPQPESEFEAGEAFEPAGELEAFDLEPIGGLEATDFEPTGALEATEFEPTGEFEPISEFELETEFESDIEFMAETDFEPQPQHAAELDFASELQDEPEPQAEPEPQPEAHHQFEAEVPPEQVEEQIAAQAREHFSEPTEEAAEPVVEPPLAELPPVPLPPVPPSLRRPAFEYVDLAALLDENDDDEAEQSTRFVVAEMPPTGDEEKDFADMLQQFKEKVAQTIPKDDAGSHYDLGIAFKEMGLIDEAIGEFQTALRSGQDKLKVYEELGSCFMAKQQYSVAITVLNRAQQMPHGDDTELLGVYYNLGRAHEELGQKAEAKAAFEKIVAIDIGFQDTTKRLTRL